MWFLSPELMLTDMHIKEGTRNFRDVENIEDKNFSPGGKAGSLQGEEHPLSLETVRKAMWWVSRI